MSKPKQAVQVGARFGRLTVVAATSLTRYATRSPLWECRCDCGETVLVVNYSLSSGRTRSCGCLNNEVRAARFTKLNTTHGLRFHPLHRTWDAMLRRCLNEQHPAYRHYGGRGITVCDRWQGPDGFPNFLADMGEKPGPAYSIDRIDNDGNYEPANCRWATSAQQANNRRRKSTVV